jgi:hypothetical protein
MESSRRPSLRQDRRAGVQVQVAAGYHHPRHVRLGQQQRRKLVAGNGDEQQCADHGQVDPVRSGEFHHRNPSPQRAIRPIELINIKSMTACLGV